MLRARLYSAAHKRGVWPLDGCTPPRLLIRYARLP